MVGVLRYKGNFNYVSVLEKQNIQNWKREKISNVYEVTQKHLIQFEGIIINTFNLILNLSCVS